MESSFKSLKVYQLAYRSAMEIFEVTKGFPKEEKYSLIDQIRRSSRSVCANIAEGYRKRQYVKMFVNKMSDADCEASETTVWLDFSKDCEYLNDEKYNNLIQNYADIGKMLGSMMQHPEKFTPRK
jgi:four helix bundle protein